MGTLINITNSNSDVYIVDGVNNGTISLVRETLYDLNINAVGHPFWIQTVPGGHSINNIYTSPSITNNGTSNGNIILTLPNDSPDTLYYACQFHATMNGTIIITDPVASNLLTPTISDFSIPNQTYSNGATFTITQPSSNSTGKFSYTSSNTNIASISGSTVTILQAGTVTITATQVATAIYESGTITASLTINKATPTITGFSIPNRDYSYRGRFNITPPTSNSSDEYSYTSSDTTIATINGDTVEMEQAGTTIITASQVETENYTSGSITTPFTVNKAFATITDFSIPNRDYLNGDTFILKTPTSISRAGFVYTSSNTNIATISGDIVTILQSGTVTITATQLENNRFVSNSITTSFTIYSPFVNSLIELQNYLKNTVKDITFIHLTAAGKLNNNISSLIYSINLKYNKSYEYIEISNNVINSYYSSIYKLPSLLTFKKIKYNDTTYLQPYLVISYNNLINNFIMCSLDINSMQALKDHLKYTTYDITVLRLNKFSSLKSIYIDYMLISANLIYKKNYDYFDLDVDEINKFYTLQNNSTISYVDNIKTVNTNYSYVVKALPAMLYFNKSKVVNSWIPCNNKITGDNIDNIKEFIRTTLKN